MRTKTLALVLTACLVIVACCGFTTVETPEPVRTERQVYLHELAEQARAYGESEDSAVIKALQAEWAQEQLDLSIIAKTIFYEAGGMPEWHKIAVGAVILNRVASDQFPNSVYEVVAQPKQYLKSYTYGFDNIPYDCWLAAKAVMDGNHDVPSDVYWQAEFVQGREIWKISKWESFSTTYFCRGFWWE